MTTLSAARTRAYANSHINGLPILTSTTIWAGGAVGINPITRAVRALVGGDLFVGFAQSSVNHVLGQQRDTAVSLVQSGQVTLAVSGAVQADVGKDVYATDDDTFTLSSTGASFVGVAKQLVSAGKLLVEIAPPSMLNVVRRSSDGTALLDGAGIVLLRSPAQKFRGGVVCDWSAQYGALAMVSTDAGDDVAVDTAVTFVGQPTIKCTFSNAASGTYIARYTPTNPISFKGVKSIQIPIKITCNESASGVAQEPTATFQIWFKTATAKTFRAQLTASKVPPGGWNVFSINEDVTTYLTFSGGATWATFDTETITAIDIVQTTIAASVNYPVWVGPISINAKAVGRVSIRMDGEYISQYTLAKPLLDTYNFKVSLALTESLIGSSASFMTAAQISEMYLQGHDCIHHTYDNTKTGGYVAAGDWASSAIITDDIKAGWNYMATQGWTRGIGLGVEGYVPCFISTTAKARQELVFAGMKAAGMAAMVSGVGQSTIMHSLAAPKEKPFYLCGTTQVTSTTTPADLIAIIDRAEELGEWAIITFHRLVTSGAGSLEMTTADFATVLAYLSSRVQAGGVIVDPISKVYDEFYGLNA